VGTGVRLIYCADGNPAFAAAAVEAGWLYGARLPATVYQPVYFADQDWKAPDRTAYMASLAVHRPAFATVLDWERDDQLCEVLGWAEEAAQHVTEAVVIVPKVVGGIPSIPRKIGDKRVILGYSVPTSYGGSPLPLWEFTGWPIHLLGGSPQAQMRLWSQMALTCEVVSVDGNMSAQQARRGRVWTSPPGTPVRRNSFWQQLRDLGDDRDDGVPLECFRRSLDAIRLAWTAVEGRRRPSTT
jgi:hypothetical protein